MAKAADIEVAPDEPYAHAAARIVRVRADELFAQAEGVLDTADIERVHDMRVASRRLRAALEVFAPCFPKREHKRCLADVKRLADALGERRDPDVALAAIRKLAKKMPTEDGPGLGSFAASLEDEQVRANLVLREVLTEVSESGLEARLAALASTARMA